MLEHLESRRLLALSITATGGVLQLTGSPYNTSGNDVWEISLNGSTIEVRNGAGTLIASHASSGITGVNVSTGGGNDFVRLGRADGSRMPSITATINGGQGDDTLIGGNKNDSIVGDVGNDKLDGRAGSDLIDGQAGFDTVDYSYRTVPVTVTLGDSTANDGSSGTNTSSPATYGDGNADNVKNTEAVLGGSGADKLIGSATAEWFDGGGGNDSIFGGAGVDTITGGVNSDLAYGEGGNNYFFMQDSAGDKFLGGAGTTTFAQYDTTLDTPAPTLVSSPSSNALIANSLLASSSLSPFALPATPSLDQDSTFGSNADGTVLTPLDGSDATINDVVIEHVGDDEKILVVGTAFGPNENYDFVLIRYNPDGSLDSTFGPDNNGVVFTDFSGAEGNDDTASSVVIDSEGRIVVAGTATNLVTGESQYAIARYHDDGSLDTDFGSAGKDVVNPDDSFSNDHATRIALEDVFNGETTIESYVILGTIAPENFGDFSSDSSTIDWGLIRLDEFGNQDSTFGDNGLQRLDYFSTDDVATGLAIDPETNNIWVSGYTLLGNRSDVLVAGYDQDGAQIPGALGTASLSQYDYAYASVIDGSQLLVVGSASDYGEGEIISFNIDSSSSTPLAGVNTYNYVYDPNGNVNLYGVALDGDGHGIAVGSIGGDSAYYVYRFNTDGLGQYGDPSTIDFGDSEATAFANGVAVQDDGNIVVAGTFSDPSAGVVRLTEHVDHPFVDQTIDPQDFDFSYTDDSGTHPLPTYLTDHITALGADGTLELSGTNLDDNICATEANGIITVTINGDLYQFTASEVTKIVLHGLDGNDYICVDSSITIPTFLDGGKGNDSIYGGGGPNEIHGGDGNDSLTGGDNNDSIFGENGNDTIKAGKGSDYVSGGNDNDNIDGGDGADSINGDSGNDTVTGGKGNDSIHGGNDNDKLDGGDDNDSVYGDAGKDSITGGKGNDELHGGNDNDTVDGGDDNDVIYGEAGNDSVIGGNGNDIGFGGDGNDSIQGNAGRDILIGGAGNDRLDGGSGDDILDGGTTSFDNNLSVMQLFLQEWTRTDINYATRVSHITNGGGLNTTNKLNSSTVTSSGGAPDTLTGGADNDLFFLASTGDKATDKSSSETKVTVHG